MKKQNTTTKATSAQKTEAAGRNTVYKVCRLGTVNGIYSALAGKYGKCEPFTRLSYRVGEVTTAPAAGNIFIYLDKAFAVDQASKMAKRYAGVKVSVFTAKPLGDVVIPAGKSKTATTKAIILGSLLKAITVTPPAPPKPVWKDVTFECTAKIADGGTVGKVVDVFHGSVHVARLSLTLSKTYDFGGYKVEKTGTGCMWGGFRVMKKA